MNKTRSLGIQVQSSKSTAVQTKRLPKEGRLKAQVRDCVDGELLKCCIRAVPAQYQQENVSHAS